MKLLVLRHGQALDPPPGGDDIDRPLSAAGREAAATLGPVVQGLGPDFVLCSTALRARQTLDALELDGLPGTVVDVAYEAGLYGAEAEELLEQVREIDHDISVALLVGHNPGVHNLVIELAGGASVPRFKPATLAVLDLDVEQWWAVGPGSGSIVSLHVPDELAQ
jgi:phosphohistidine phosphatase